MSLLKFVQEGLKPRKCKRVKLCEPPPVPNVPTKDKVQDEVAKLSNLKIKTTIEKDTMLNFPVRCKNGTRKAFLMHVTVVLDAIKKCGHFYNYEKAAKDHKESTKAVESARAALSLLNGTGAKAK
jgi:adenylate cyclase class IV